MEKKLTDQKAADIMKENEMLFSSEERVKRLLEEANELRAELRHKEREIAHLNDQVAKLNDEVVARVRDLKLKELEQEDRQT